MIDWERVAELRDEVGREDFLEVAELFTSEVEGVLARLAGGANVASLENDMHFLKGAALNLGFRDFAALCKEGECRAAAQDFASVDIGAVTASFAASKETFASGLAGESQAETPLLRS